MKFTLEIEDCIQDCPLCRSTKTQYVCIGYRPPQILAQISDSKYILDLKPITPPHFCPLRAIEKAQQ